MNIIGLEWIELGILCLLGICLICNFCIQHYDWPDLVCWIILSVEIVGIVAAFTIGIPLASAQDKVENKYIEYLELRAEYAEADSLEKLELDAEVKEYNLWFEETEDERNNPWHFMGTSSFATKFEKIEVK